MAEAPRDVLPEVSPGSRPLRIRRLVKLLVAVDVVVLVVAGGIWFALRSDERDNVVNEGLRGSLPPAGVTWPDLAGVDGITPRFPTLDDARGRATMLVATCIECPSGDVIGGFLGRLGEGALPEEARVVVLALDGDLDSWTDRWNVDPERVELHSVQGEQPAATVRRTLGIGQVADAEESGITYLHDTTGARRSTFFLGQLDRADVAHDLEQLAGD